MQARLQQLQNLIVKLPEKKISSVLLLMIVIYIAFLSAQLFWLIWPKPEAQVLMPTITATGKAAKSISTDAIQAQNIFGAVNTTKKVEKKPEPKVIDNAPETKLNISLTGVVAVDKDDQAGLAIIESQGAQETYEVDDVVTGTRAQIKQILAERVILQVNGRFETLMLDGIDFSKEVTASTTSRNKEIKPVKSRAKQRIQATNDAKIKQELRETRDVLLKEPGKLFDYIRVSPSRKNGELVGYRLRPGKDPALFKKMGLKNNDLAISINGYELTDMKQAMSAMGELRSASSATIVIDRDGEQLDVLFSLD